MSRRSVRCGVAFLASIALAACARHGASPGSVPPTAQARAPELVVQQGPTSIITSLAVDRRNRLLASASKDGIRLWDLGSGHVLRTFSSLNPGRIDTGDVAFSADSTQLVNRSEFGRQRIFDIRSGALVPAPAFFSPAPQPRHTCTRPGMNCVMSVSPDGRWSATAIVSTAAMLAWENDVSARTLPLERVELRREPSRVLWRTWTTSDSYFCEGRAGEFFCNGKLVFSDDGRSAALETSERTISLVDLRAYRTEHTTTLPPRDTGGRFVANGTFGRVQAFTFTSGGRALVVGDDIGDIEIVDAASGRAQPFWNVSSAAGPSGVALSPNGQWLVAGAGAHSELWDLTTGQPATNLGGLCSPVFSADSRRIACVEPHTLTVWNAGMGSPIATWTLQHLFENGRELVLQNVEASFSPDGTKLFATRDRQPRAGSDVFRIASILDIATRREIDLSSDLQPSMTVGVAGHGAHVTWMENDGSVERYDFATNRVVRVGSLSRASLSGGNTGLTGFLDGGITGDGRYAVVLPENAINDRTIGYTIYDTTTTRVAGVPHQDGAKLLGFTSDGGSALFGDQDDTLAVVDVRTGVTTHRYAGHADEVEGAAYSADGGTLVSASDDDTVRFWDARTERQLGVMFPGAGGPYDWLVASPDGAFDGSPGGWNAMLWRFGGDTFEVSEPETFFNDFFRPGLLADLVRRRPAPLTTIATIDRRAPAVDLEVLSPQPYGRRVRVRLNVTPAPADKTYARAAGARDVRLVRNGSLVHLWAGDVLRGSSHAALEAVVTLVAGRNDLEAYAFNGDGVRSAPVDVAVASPHSPRPGKAYVLAIGVNRYANANFSLHYAASDANAFADEMRRVQRRLYGSSNVVVSTLVDARATRAGIRAALGAIARRANPEDLVYVYFAGHGAAYRDRYYLVPFDLGYTGTRGTMTDEGFQTIIDHSISDLDLARDMLPIDARKIALVIDACESGQALGNGAKIGPMNAKGIAQLAYDKGMYVLAAAQSDQNAIETSYYGHGLLTYALVEEALNQREAVDPASPDALTLRQWLAFAAGRVPQLQLATIRAGARTARDTGEDRSLQRPRVYDPPYAYTDGLLVATFAR